MQPAARPPSTHVCLPAPASDSTPHPPPPPSTPHLSHSYEAFAEDTQAGDMLVVDGGMVSLEVVSKAGPDVVARVVDPGGRRHVPRKPPPAVPLPAGVTALRGAGACISNPHTRDGPE